MAVLALLSALGQGLVLPSVYSLYTFLMCRVHAARTGQQAPDHQAANELLSGLWNVSSATPASPELRLLEKTRSWLPPTPHLPTSSACSDPWVPQATSAFSASMATTGAILSLILLGKATFLSRRFGRKPILLFSNLVIVFGYATFPLSPRLTAYLAPALVALGIVAAEGSAGAPQRMAVQNYVVDCTGEAARASALSFIEGFGQLGAFPAATLGGWLAAATGQFFAPFYGGIAMFSTAVLYVLLFVPESKRKHVHTFIDDWEHRVSDSDESAAGAYSAERERHEEQDQRNTSNISAARQQQGGNEQRNWRDSRRTSTFSFLTTSSTAGAAQRLASSLNIINPLGIFIPRRRPDKTWDLRLLNLGLITVFDEAFQIFIVPLLLLYNSDSFGFDVVQNGYLVTLIQGTRAIYLTLIFPRSIAWARKRVARRAKSKREAHARAASGETTPLLRQDDEEEERESYGKLDFVILLTSYLVAATAFTLIALARRFSRTHADSTTLLSSATLPSDIPPWRLLVPGVIMLELASGTVSVRTALVVNTLPSSEQTRAIQANQILSTIVLTLVPLTASAVYSFGLEKGHPEAVWLAKAGCALGAALGSLALFWTHRHRNGEEEQGDAARSRH
ncbi:hypothetical protein CBOM_00399 [Ceraceosorus bombacis]|uniref:Uncharacterized protein n=1 Tax=Ceraceosorus bombacis TaxID=401625 RepID=A0A0P1B8Y5_9BASI|nr:hypothetical protein CBOM_00399 [Ceraceosorus bombacis]